MRVDWASKQHFSRDEFGWTHCGAEQMQEAFLVRLDLLRDLLGFPLVVTSGWRCRDHPLEAGKPEPGAHSMGIAVDLAVKNHAALETVRMAAVLGFTGIGVNQKGTKRYIHLDTLEPGDPIRPRPTIWSY